MKSRSFGKQHRPIAYRITRAMLRQLRMAAFKARYEAVVAERIEREKQDGKATP